MSEGLLGISILIITLIPFILMFFLVMYRKDIYESFSSVKKRKFTEAAFEYFKNKATIEIMADIKYPDGTKTGAQKVITFNVGYIIPIINNNRKCVFIISAVNIPLEPESYDLRDYWIRTQDGLWQIFFVPVGLHHIIPKTNISSFK